MKRRTIGYVIAGIIALNGCNFLARTAEGLGRLGERMYTGVKEDIESVRQNYTKEPYSLTGKEETMEEKSPSEKDIRE